MSAIQSNFGNLYDECGTDPIHVIMAGIKSLRKDTSRIGFFLNSLDQIWKSQPANGNPKYYAHVCELKDRVSLIKQNGEIHEADFKKLVLIQVKLQGLHRVKQDDPELEVQAKELCPSAQEQKLRCEIQFSYENLVGPPIYFAQIKFKPELNIEKFDSLIPSFIQQKIFAGNKPGKIKEETDKLCPELVTYCLNHTVSGYGHFMPSRNFNDYLMGIGEAQEFYSGIINLYSKIRDLAALILTRIPTLSKQEPLRRDALMSTVQSSRNYLPKEIFPIIYSYAIPDEEISVYGAKLINEFGIEL